MATPKLGDYQFVEPIPDKFKCLQCKKLLEEPHVTECCGQHFCKKCIEESSQQKQQQRTISTHQTISPQVVSSTMYWPGVTRNSQTRTYTISMCPSCKTRDFKHIRYLPLKRKINDLIVYCPHKAKGCTEQVKLENIEAHVSNCNYQSMWCINNCGQALLRGQLQDHITKSCPQRIINCQYCRDDYPYVETHDHQKICSNFPLPCLNRCGESRIKRKDMSSHKNVCPLEIVNCTFAEVGCTHCGQRKNLPAHIKENVEAHLSLMMEAHLKLKQELLRRSYSS